MEIPAKQILTVDDFFESFEDISNLNNEEILNLNFELNRNKKRKEKIRTIIKIAEHNEAKEIAKIFADAYKGTYPYKNVEDVQELRRMILDPNHIWFLFNISEGESVGCCAVQIDPKEKKGRFHGFVIKTDYRHKIDVFKIFVGYALYVWKNYKNQISEWFLEARTNEQTAQSTTSLCGFKPNAFYPNKDIFLNKIESDFLSIIYNRDALGKYRSRKTPKIIRQVLDSYTHCNRRYHLGVPIVENPSYSLNSKRIDDLRERVYKKIKNGNFYNQTIIFFIENSESFFKFSYNPIIHTFENSSYKISQLEELYVFLEGIRETMEHLHIRYFQCFVSAYEPLQQVLFKEAGFKPSGYVPSWKYNEEINFFEDHVVFVYFEGNIDIDIQLIPETIEFLKDLKYLPLIKKKTKLKISTRILTDSVEILNYLQLGTNIPILHDLNEYIIHDLKYFKARSLLLLDNGNPTGQVLIYDDGRDVLFFGYFGVLNYNPVKINFLIDKLIEYAKEHNYKIIRGPINIPSVIFGWGFMKENSVDSLYIGKPIDPPIYMQSFLKKKFSIINEQITWSSYPMPHFDPWKLKKYDFTDYEYFYPKDINDFENYKDEFLRIHAENLPPSARITPDIAGVLDNYVNFVFKYGFNFMFFFVRYKPNDRIIACGVFLPNPFRKDPKGNYDSCVAYSWAVEPEHRQKGIVILMYGATTQLLWKNKIRCGSGIISSKNYNNTSVALKLGTTSSRVHLVLEYKVQ